MVGEGETVEICLGGVWTSYKIFKKGGLDRTSTFREVWPISVTCSFYIKNKLKSYIFNSKKIYKQKCFFVITYNLNWETLTKNLVAFKRWDGVKDEKF